VTRSFFCCAELTFSPGNLNDLVPSSIPIPSILIQKRDWPPHIHAYKLSYISPSLYDVYHCLIFKAILLLYFIRFTYTPKTNYHAWQTLAILWLREHTLYLADIRALKVVNMCQIITIYLNENKNCGNKLLLQGNLKWLIIKYETWSRVYVYILAV
jgi:hypothetical protein